jgi:hypothetical protein
MTYHEFHQGILGIRYALFTRWRSRPDFWHAPPGAWAEHGFLTDPPSLISEWRGRLSNCEDLGGRLSAIESLDDDALKAKSVALLCYPPGPVDKGRRKVHHRDLLTKIRTVPLGYGCCSDRSEAFLALASVVGLPAREVQNSRHCTNEFYHGGLGRWIFIDADHAHMARGEDGDYLSFTDLRDYCSRGIRAVMLQFGQGDYPLEEQACRGDPWYYEHEAAWSRVALVQGNNVFSDERWQRRLRFVPKFVSHLVGHCCGVRPSYAMFTGHRLDYAARRAAVGFGAS